MNLFLDYGADPNGIRPSGLGGYYGTPLNAAVRRGNIEMVKLLLEKGADPYISANKKGWTALELACFCAKPDAFNLLLEKAPDFNAVGRYGTLLQAAACAGAKSFIRDLLHRGADVNANGQGPYGNSLQSAAIRGKEDVVRFLIKRGADIRVKGGQFGTVLQAASIRCSKGLVGFLIHKGANVDEQGGRYRTALQAACAAGNKPVVLTLLEQKANVNITGGRYGSALQAACLQGSLEVVRMLVEHGANVESRGGYYESAIDATALHGRTKILQYLVKEAGAARTTASRRHKHNNTRWLERADKNIHAAFEAPESSVESTKRNPRIAQDETGVEEEATMNIESIPQYDLARIDTTTSSSSSPDPMADLRSNATKSSSETTIPDTIPTGKKYRRRLARKESNKNAVKEETKEVDPAADEDMSALSWLQVECGYGGDLNGPGR